MTCRTTIPNRQAAERATVSIYDQVAAVAEELPHQIERLRLRAQAGKIHWGFFTIRKRQLTAALETLQRLRRQQAALEEHPSQADSVPNSTRTAPERIWLCLSDTDSEKDMPFPTNIFDVAWAKDRPVDVTVEYVRADIAEQRAQGAAPLYGYVIHHNNGEELFTYSAETAQAYKKAMVATVTAVHATPVPSVPSREWLMETIFTMTGNAYVPSMNVGPLAAELRSAMLAAAAPSQKEPLGASEAPAARQQTGLALLREIIASDATAISYQSLGQYRAGLLREIDAQLLDSRDAEAAQIGYGSPL